MLTRLAKALQPATSNPAQVWTSPSIHAMYTFACRKASSDRDTYPQDASKMPIPYLWLLWSSRWIPREANISYYIIHVCNVMSRAITDPTSKYRLEDAILSVERFVASSGVIGEAELRVFFWALRACEHCDTSTSDGTARLLFFSSLTLKLCQQSNVSTAKIFAFLVRAGFRFRDEVRLLFILPLLRDLALKTVLLEDNTVVHVGNTNLPGEVSPELDEFVEAFCFTLAGGRDSLNDNPESTENYGLVSVLSLLPTLNQSRGHPPMAQSV
jgi:hypothetical protein